MVTERLVACINPVLVAVRHVIIDIHIIDVINKKCFLL